MCRLQISVASLVLVSFGLACSNGSKGSGPDGGSDSRQSGGDVAKAGADAYAGTLGLSCKSSCDGTFCNSGGTAITAICGSTSGLSMPCIGTATGMYCTQPCTADSDCAPAVRTMRCLAVCGKYPSSGGLCWSASDHDFMTSRVCGTATPDSGVSNRDAAPDLAEAGRDIANADVAKDIAPDVSDAGRDMAADLLSPADAADRPADLGPSRDVYRPDSADANAPLDSGIDTGPVDPGPIDTGEAVDNGLG